MGDWIEVWIEVCGLLARFFPDSVRADADLRRHQHKPVSAESFSSFVLYVLAVLIVLYPGCFSTAPPIDFAPTVSAAAEAGCERWRSFLK
jgi:hypothetical protein